MYHKRRVKTSRNALCGKIPESELYCTPSLGKSTTCTEAIGSIVEVLTRCHSIGLGLTATSESFDIFQHA